MEEAGFGDRGDVVGHRQCVVEKNSRILEMKLRFEIGRKLLRSSVDRDGFLRRGCTRACLNDDGKIPSERERLTRLVMIGPSSLKQSFKRKVGMESRGHCLLSEAEMSL